MRDLPGSKKGRSFDLYFDPSDLTMSFAYGEP
jgi:hypothetical protein